MSPPPYRPCLRTKAAALLLLLVVGFAGAKAFDDEIVQGPYEVRKTSMAPEDWFGGHTFRIYTPNGTKAEEKFPAVIFAHGLCGPEEDYEGILRVIASRGFIVLANAEQEYCGRASVSAFFQFLTNDPFPDLRRAADGEVMIDNLREEVDFVLSKNESFPYDEGAGIALVGHSMGGAAVLDLAASLGSSKPVRGVAAIAPWNGITDAATPSSVAGNIKSPVLLFCSKMDQLCPCSGEVGAATGAGQNWASDFLFNTIFAGRTKDWFGGVDAIFDAAAARGGGVNTTLVELSRGGHFAMAGIGRKQLEDLGRRMGQLRIVMDIGISAAEINTGTSVSETGGLVLRVTTAFLEETLRGDETEFVDALRDVSSEEDGVTIRTGAGE